MSFIDLKLSIATAWQPKTCNAALMVSTHRRHDATVKVLVIDFIYDIAFMKPLIKGLAPSVGKIFQFGRPIQAWQHY